MKGECEECDRQKLSLQRSAVNSERSLPSSDGVPSIVQDVLRTPGEPLEPTTRAFFEPRFGHDFSQVRVHTDGPAANSAKAVRARAYTSSHNIVFAAGEYSPQTESGRFLISHELTHVLQQRAGVQLPGNVGAVDDRYEQEADVAANQVVRGGSANVSYSIEPTTASSMLQRKKPAEETSEAGPPVTPTSEILYYNGTLTVLDQTEEVAIGDLVAGFNELKIEKNKVAGLDWPQIKNVLNVENKKITGYEIDKKVTILQASKRNSLGFTLWQVVKGNVPDPLPWGSELDMSRKLFGPPQTDALVTIRITPEGLASIELISETAATVPAQGQGGAEALLKSEFKVAEISDDGDAEWADDELDKVVAAFRLVPGADKSALAGIRLIKVRAIPDADAQFERPPGSAPVLRVANTTFVIDGRDRDASDFVGGTAQALPRSTQTILHEVGHAVADLPTRDLDDQLQVAVGQENAEKAKITDPSIATTAGLDSALAVVDALISKKHDLEITPATLAPFVQAAASTRTIYEDALKATQTAGTQAQDTQALAAAGSYLQNLLDHFDPVTLLRDYKAWLLSRGGWSPELDSLSRAQENWAKAAVDLAYARQRTRRVQEFVDLVEANKIKRFTLYSEANWPQKPGEFFAEAYSLFLTDPEFLENNYNLLYTFFKSGDFR